jgi:phosphoglucomutase
LSAKGHYPEKDGILACLLPAQAVAARGASLSEQLASLSRRSGRLESCKIGVRLVLHIMANLLEKLKQELTAIGGRRTKRANRMDGMKFIFETARGIWYIRRVLSH